LGPIRAAPSTRASRAPPRWATSASSSSATASCWRCTRWPAWPAYALGHGASTLGAQLHLSPAVLLLALLPHAAPELFGLFLPLAAWTIASRRGAWHELLAATFVTTGIAIPLIVVAGAVETWVSPRLLVALSG
jgi:hypothetical protein